MSKEERTQMYNDLAAAGMPGDKLDLIKLACEFQYNSEFNKALSDSVWQTLQAKDVN